MLRQLTAEADITLKLKDNIHTAVRYGIAAVWLVNGLYCKVLNMVPRHRDIVERILGPDYSGVITRTIGVLEILMSAWVLSKVKPRLCAYVQMVLIAVMNAIEFSLAPDLLLFGRANSIVAILFIVVIYLNDVWSRRRSGVYSTMNR